ncbi:helix-turn-helix domain-containing protein [Pedobacter metabolipauper]|uniref:DnaA-like protein n=1 Tax=Pedobacter metabolipauper TaxID=425513 RepID=A0A4R6T1C8_9SPHI|nr:hypothetical protein [Pedobacter metabolipauper]TDQ12205.1 hypothetical protein ATK78_1339 [Pedobacter metabolipauper]
MTVKPNRTVLYSDTDRKIIYDFWFNPNQTMKNIADKYGVSDYLVSKVTSQFIRTKDEERQKILKEAAALFKQNEGLP